MQELALSMLQDSEIKHARTSMLALGYYSTQRLLCLCPNLSDPWQRLQHNNPLNPLSFPQVTNETQSIRTAE